MVAVRREKDRMIRGTEERVCGVLVGYLRISLARKKSGAPGREGEGRIGTIHLVIARPGHHSRVLICVAERSGISPVDQIV